MAIYIENIYIDSFRGIHQLAIDSTSHINIIVGDNNCGKTSILEAMLLLRNPADFANVLRIARLRKLPLFMGGSPSIYENFISLFANNKSDKVICINAG